MFSFPYSNECDVDKPITEAEKVCLTSGKSIDDIEHLMDAVRYSAYQPNYMLLSFIGLLYSMHRVQTQSNSGHETNLYTIRSINPRLWLVRPTHKLSTDERTLLLQDMIEYHRTLQELDQMHTLRAFLQPNIPIFDSSGDLLSYLDRALIHAGAYSISVESSAQGEINLVICSSYTKIEFMAKLKERLNLIPNVVYTQIPRESMISGEE